MAAARKAKREQVDALRAKLPEFAQTASALMHLTDHCEESLAEIITSLDTQLFERLTGPIHEDFQKPTDLGVFHLTHLCEAISQFRLLKRASLAALEHPRAATPDGRSETRSVPNYVPRRVG